jgi:hypothetical protein
VKALVLPTPTASSRSISRLRSRRQFSALETRTLYSADIGLSAALAGAESTQAATSEMSARPAAFAKDSSVSEKEANASSNTDARPQKEFALDLLRLASEANIGRSTTNLEVILIDSRVPDIAVLRADFQRQIDSGRHLAVMVIDLQTDGITRATQMLALAGEPVSALHIISHGQAGSFELGSSVLDTNQIEARSADLANWSRYLSKDADILLYGCNIASNDSGVDFVSRLGEITGADVAASRDTTGAKELGANWELEYRSGQVSASNIATTDLQAHWRDILTSSVSGPLPVNATTVGPQTAGAASQTGHNVSVNSHGDIAVTWLNWPTNQVMLRLFHPDGSARTGEIAVAGLSLSDPGSPLKMTPVVAVRDDGTSVVAWLDDHGSPGNDKLLAQRFTPEGAALGAVIDVTGAAGSNGYARPDIGAASNGEFYISYEAYTGADSDVKVSGFQADGTAKFTHHAVGLGGPEFEGEASIAVKPDGSGFVMSWTVDAHNSYLGGFLSPGIGTEIGASRFDSSGNVVSSGFLGSGVIWTNTTSNGNQYQSAIAIAADGTYVVTYVSDGALGGQDLLVTPISATDATGTEVTISAGNALNWNHFPSVVTSTSGKYAVVWEQSTSPLTAGFADARILTYGSSGALGFGSGTYIIADTPGTTYTVPRIATNGNVIVTDYTRILSGQYAYNSGTGFYSVGGPAGSTFNDVEMWVKQSSTATANGPFAPINILPGGPTVLEDNSIAFTLAAGNAIQLGDSDATGDIKVTVRVPAGQGTLSIADASMVTDPATPGLYYAGGVSGSGIVLQGSVSALNQALAQLIYTPAANANGSVVLTMTSAELYGPILTRQIDIDTVSISITPVADAPSGSNGTISAIENTPYVFLVSDFGFSDSIDSPSHSFAGLDLSSLPATGTLSLNGLPVAAGQHVNITDLAAGRLRYLPPLNTSGLAVSSFSFQVTDTGSVSNGGTFIDATPKTLSIDVAAVNQAPVVASNAFSIDEGQRVILNSSMLLAGDVDNPLPSTLIFTASSVNNGQFERVTQPGLAITSFTQDEINNGAIAFAHDGSEVAPSYKVVVSDGIASSASNSANLTFTNINDAPAISTGPLSIVINEDSFATFKATNGNAFVISDVDAGPSAVVQLTLSSSYGTVNLSSFTGLTKLAGANNTSFLQLRGNISDLNAAIDGLALIPSLNFVGVTTLDVTVNDLGNSGVGGALTATKLTAMSVLPVNDAPVGQNRSISIDEDSSYLLTQSDFGFSDPNDTPANGFAYVQVTSLPGAGTLTLSGAAVAPNQFISVADLNSGNLRYSPPSNDNGLNYASFGFKVKDNGGTTNGGSDLSGTIYTLRFDVNPVNDSPTFTYPTGSLSTFEDSALVFASSGPSAITISDPDAASGALQISLSATNTRIKLASPNGLTFVSGTDGSSAMVVSGTLLDLNAALHGLIVAPTANFNGTSILTVVVDDLGNTGSGVSLSPSWSSVLSVVATNDAPVGANKVATLTENTSYTLVKGDFGFNDPIDVPANNFAFVRVSALPTQGQLSLAGAAVSVNQQISIAQIEAGSLTYTPGVNGNGTNYAQLSFKVIDDGGTANGGINTSVAPNVLRFDVGATNSSPTILIQGGAFSVVEDGAFVFSVANGNALVFNDPDAGNGVMQLALSAPNAKLSLATSAGITVINGANNATMMVIEGTLTSLNNAVQGLKLAPSSDFVGTISLTMTIDDLGNTGTGGSLTASTVETVEVISVNDAPRGADHTATLSENGRYALTPNDFGFSDSADTPANSFASVKITTLPTAGKLTLAGATVTLNQVISVSSINAGSLVFTPATNTFGTNYATFDFKVKDNGGVANAGKDTALVGSTISFDVARVNMPPVNQAPSVVSGIEDTPLVFSVNPGSQTLSVSDPDGNVTMEITLSATHGSLSLGSTNGLNFRLGDGTQDGILRFQGSVNDVNAALNGLVFDPELNYAGAAQIIFKSSDLGQSGTGGVMTDSSTVRINLAAVNDLPVLQNALAINVSPGAKATVSRTNLLTTDKESSADKIIYTLESDLIYGNLLLNGQILKAGDTFTQADVNSGRLSFKSTGTTSSVDTLRLTARDGNGASTGPISLSLDIRPPASALPTSTTSGSNSSTSSTVASVITTAKADAKAAVDFTGSQSTSAAVSGPAFATSAAGDSSSVNKPVSRTGAGSENGPVQRPSSEINVANRANTGFARVDTPRLLEPVAMPPSATELALNGVSPSKGAQAEIPSKTVELTRSELSSQGIQLPAQAISIEKMMTDNSFQKELKQVRDDVLNVAALDRGVVASTIGVSASFTIGYVLWLVRGGVLISSLLASLPAWRMVDPLPVLGSLGNKSKDNDDKSLDELINESHDKPPELDQDDPSEKSKEVVAIAG